MIQRLKHLTGCTVAASDGTIGKVKDLLFDDREWAVRYLVVDTGTTLTGRSVLISPLFLRGVDWLASAVESTLAREQVKSSPDIDFDKPVSRQQEEEYYRHYRSFGYWAGPYIWGPIAYPLANVSGVGVPEQLADRMRRNERETGDAHLRSANEVQGYDIQAVDGGVGHVEDFLFDDETWLIEALLVDTRNWLPGKHVMIPPDWVVEVDWSQRDARVDVDRETIRARPEYRGDLSMLGARGAVEAARGVAGRNLRDPP